MIEQEGVENFLKRMMQEAVVVDLKTYYILASNTATKVAHSACAIYPDPIPGKSVLFGLDVSSTFSYIKVAIIEYLYIELEFPSRREKFVLASKYDNEAIEFLKATVTLGYFVFTDNPLTGEGIRIPIVEPRTLTDILAHTGGK